MAAFRVLALARCLWTMFCPCTRSAAMLLANGSLTVTAWMFAFLCCGHKVSLYPDMPSLVWRLCNSQLDSRTMQFCCLSHGVECTQLTRCSAVHDGRMISTMRVRDWSKSQWIRTAPYDGRAQQAHDVFRRESLCPPLE